MLPPVVTEGRPGMGREPVLAIDLGGTKLAVALVHGGIVVERREAPTDRRGGAAAWIAAAARLAEGWHGFRTVGLAVTGLVRDGLWSALNPGTLPVPEDFPLVEALRSRFGLPAVARNDAQAAAWGEFTFGAGQRRDMVFLTVSTGIGGGIVAGGRLIDGRSGLAGHFGVAALDTRDGARMLEEVASGSALARLAEGRGARAVTAAACLREPWALSLLDRVTIPLAGVLARLQLELDPEVVVIGGGLGLDPGYLDHLRRHLAPLPPLKRPMLRAAALGANAGLIGVADLATRQAPEGKR